jgi:hypothetical protein
MGTHQYPAPTTTILLSAMSAADVHYDEVVKVHRDDDYRSNKLFDISFVCQAPTETRVIAIILKLSAS